MPTHTKEVMDSKIPNLMLHYTGFSCDRFEEVYNFFVPDEKSQPFKYQGWRKDILKVVLNRPILVSFAQIKIRIKSKRFGIQI